MTYRPLKFLAFVVGLLPSWALERLAFMMAVLVFDILRVRRRLILSNIATAGGDRWSARRRIQIGRRSVYHFALTVLEVLHSSRHDLTENMSYEGLETLQKALDEGRGLYLVCCHMGNWEAMGAFLSRSVVPARIIVKKVGSPSTDRFVTELRLKNGFLPVERRKKGDGFKAIIKALNSNEIVAFVMDQARPGAPKLPFFGRPAKTNASLAAIWQRRPAPILCAYVRRVAVNKHVVHITSPLELQQSNDPEQDILSNSVTFNQQVEQMILSNPEQYFWLHNRWK